MITVILVFHVMIAAALVGIVLVQRSEGGALGIGGGGGGLMSGRGAANLLTKTTAILAALFFSTSITLAILASMNSKPKQIVAPSPTQQSGETQAPAAQPGQLPKLDLPGGPKLPQSK
jgi:preprotein translocase subunit SecG